LEDGEIWKTMMVAVTARLEDDDGDGDDDGDDDEA
jgi:hypothetical protein